MAQKILSTIIILIGLLVMIFPFTGGKDAYFIGDNFYINLKDSVESKYEPYLTKLAKSQRTKLTFQEKKDLRETLKKRGDSLELVSIKVARSNNNELIKQVNNAKNELNNLIFAKEAEIDQKYSFDNLTEEEQNQIVLKLKDSINTKDFLVILANEAFNPNESEELPVIKFEDIKIKKVHKQTPQPFIFSGILIIFSGLILFLYHLGFIPLQIKAVKTSITIILIVFVSAGISGIYNSINNRIQFENQLEKRTDFVKKRLGHIRSIQLAYFDQNKRYCSSWDTLTHFVKFGEAEIVKYLVNKDDSAAVNRAKRNKQPLEEIVKVSVNEKLFKGKTPFNLDSLAFVPFSKDKFEINSGTIDKNNRQIHVFEVKTKIYTFIQNLPYVPENFDKTKILILGSMLEPTTEGNW
jgi:hypothetical protein